MRALRKGWIVDGSLKWSDMEVGKNSKPELQGMHTGYASIIWNPKGSKKKKLFVWFFFAVLRIEPRVSCMRSTTFPLELLPAPKTFWLPTWCSKSFRFWSILDVWIMDSQPLKYIQTF
jgi:hypothetical protein